MSKMLKTGLFLLVLFLMVGVCFVLFFRFSGGEGDSLEQAQTVQSSSVSSSTKTDLPAVSRSDWELILVNRDNRHEELNPDLAWIDGVAVDSRIAQQVQDFLGAAQVIDAKERLISGYRSVAYQAELYQGYVAQEMTNNPNLTISEVEKLVQTYSQPAGASEHQTGLALDMSTADDINLSDPEVVAQIKAIAPDYGFVLRFPQDKTSSTGVGYEDWHWRYVGVASAKYMTAHNLSLEEYLQVLKENGQ